MIARAAAATLIATWALWQIAFHATDELRLPEITSYAAFATPTTVTTDSPVVTFYRRNATGQYTAFGVNKSGQIIRSLALPGETIAKADGTVIALSGKEGYITGPDNGAFYIWYPQIGQQVYVFNDQGSFLWEKDESHYLHVLPRGRFILAAAGDHSRMIFMNPDFKTQADFQGLLFTRFITDDNPELKTAQVCLGSLDGEIIVAHLDRKLYFRHKLGYALKTLACDFVTGELAAIVERSVKVDAATIQKDFLVRAKFTLTEPKDAPPAEMMRATNPDLDIIATSELPMRTVTASPLVLTPDALCFIQNTTEGATALYYTRGKKSKLQQIPLSPVTSTADNSPDLWKSTAQKIGGETACVFVHRSGRLVYANQRGLILDRPDLTAERLLAFENAVYLQGEKGIFTLR